MRLSFVSIFVVLFVVSGCRTYGGYGSEEATLIEIGDVVDDARASLALAEDEAILLERAAVQSAELNELYAAYMAVIGQHVGLVEHGAGVLADFSEEGSTYRGLSRSLGALVSEVDEVNIGYDRIIADVAKQSGIAIPASTAGRTGGDARYKVAPPAYNRTSATRFTMRDALGI